MAKATHAGHGHVYGSVRLAAAESNGVGRTAKEHFCAVGDFPAIAACPTPAKSARFVCGVECKRLVCLRTPGGILHVNPHLAYFRLLGPVRVDAYRDLEGANDGIGKIHDGHHVFPFVPSHAS